MVQYLWRDLAYFQEKDFCMMCSGHVQIGEIKIILRNVHCMLQSHYRHVQAVFKRLSTCHKREDKYKINVGLMICSNIHP
jgi:hypothetical protein